MLETPGSLIREGLSSLERILMLKRLPTIGTLPSAELAVIAELTRERFFPKGSLLLAEGEPVPAIHLLVEGRAEVRRGGVRLGTVPSGNALGALGLMAGEPFGVDAVALEDTTTLEVEADQLFDMLEDRFAILHHVLRDLSRQLVEQLIELRLDPTQVFPSEGTMAAGRELDVVERVFFLRQMAAFHKAGMGALFELSRGFTEIELPAGIVVWREGEPAGGIFVVTQGTLRCRSASGLDFTAGPGAPLGAAESLAEVPRWYEAVTATPVTGLQGSVETLVDVLEDNFDLARRYLASLAQGLIGMIQVRYERRKDLPQIGVAPEVEVATLPGAEQAPPV